MQCPKCNQSLRISKSTTKSEIGTTDVYIYQDLVCVNSKCDNYAGTDLSNPRMIVDTIKHKVG